MMGFPTQLTQFKDQTRGSRSVRGRHATPDAMPHRMVANARSERSGLYLYLYPHLRPIFPNGHQHTISVNVR